MDDTLIVEDDTFGVGEKAHGADTVLNEDGEILETDTLGETTE